MAREKLLLVSAICFLTLAGSCSAPAAFACTLAEQVAGACPEANGNFGDGGVDLEAGFGAGGGGGASGGGAQGGRDNGQGGDGDDIGVVLDGKGDGKGNGGGVGQGDVGGRPPIVRDGFTVNCVAGSPCDPALVVGMRDLVNIKPAAPGQEMEPSGWAVVGLPANFIVDATAHVRSGLLLGFPADVRFTPAGYRWAYGDGSARNTRTGGSTWAALGVPEFSETETSHSFTVSGEYTVSVTVIYTAEYRFAGRAWQGIEGTLAVPAARFSVVADDAKTVLVDRDCAANPSGPGC